MHGTLLSLLEFIPTPLSCLSRAHTWAANMGHCSQLRTVLKQQQDQVTKVLHLSVLSVLWGRAAPAPRSPSSAAGSSPFSIPIPGVQDRLC